MKTHEQFTDHNIQPGAEATACYDADLGLVWIIENVSTWAGLNELDGLCNVPVRVVGIFCGDEVLIVDESATGEES